MKKIAVCVTFFAVSIFLFKDILAWGFNGHKKITECAVEIIVNSNVPAGVKKFFVKNRKSIIERSIEPDLVRNKIKDEQYNHYIDIDRYGKFPFSELPRSLTVAFKKFGYEKVKRNGLLPWRIRDMVDSLSYAFAFGDEEKAVKYSAWLSHYVEDAHQPLHVTENYNGQLTGQIGIHWRFEVALVDRILPEFSCGWSGKKVNLKPVKDVLGFAFDIILGSYKLIDEVLYADKYAKKLIPKDKLYKVEKRNGRIRYIYSDEYYSILSGRLKNLIYRRFRTASFNLARLWLTAWERGEKLKNKIKN